MISSYAPLNKIHWITTPAAKAKSYRDLKEQIDSLQEGSAEL